MANEILKDKRVLLGGGVILLLAAGGTIFALMGGGGGDDGTGEVTDVTAPPVVQAPATPPLGGAPANPGAPGNPGAPARRPAQNAAPSAVTALRQDTRTSFDDAPPGYGGGGAAPGTGGNMPGQPPAPAPGGGAAGQGAQVNKVKEPLDPIKPGVQVAGFRVDPFVSYRIPAYVRPAATNFIYPARLASISAPPLPPVDENPDIRFGPLPVVPRRVAGILYNGVVSAILETGEPGANADVQVVQAGQAVPSGIPGINELTVQAITPNQVVLRAEDGRTVTVKLSNVPGGIGSLLGAGGGGLEGPGGPPPGVGGPPPGFGGRGGIAPPDN